MDENLKDELPAELRFTVIIPSETVNAFIAEADEEVMSHGLLARKIIVKYFRKKLQQKAMQEEAALTGQLGEQRREIPIYAPRPGKQATEPKPVPSEGGERR